MPASDLGCAARASQREAVYTMNASVLQVFPESPHCRSLDCPGICSLTIRHKYDYISHGQNQSSRSEDSSAPATGKPQPASRQGCRSAVCHLGLLRPARPGPGQVRDGAQGARGPSTRESERDGLRLLASFFLSGAGSARARRPGRLGASETGATAEAQARHGGDGLLAATAVRRLVTASAGAGPADSGALWTQGPSTQRRAGPCSREKKTPVIEPNSADAAVAAYEELRSQVLAGAPHRGGLGFGPLPCGGSAPLVRPPWARLRPGGTAGRPGPARASAPRA